VVSSDCEPEPCGEVEPPDGDWRDAPEVKGFAAKVTIVMPASAQRANIECHESLFFRTGTLTFKPSLEVPPQ
jgi:hypothetical protein